MRKPVVRPRGWGESWTIQFVDVLARYLSSVYFVSALLSGTFWRRIKTVCSGHCSMKVASANFDGPSKDRWFPQVCLLTVCLVSWSKWWLHKRYFLLWQVGWSKLAIPRVTLIADGRTSCVPWSLRILGWNRKAPSYKMQAFLSGYRHENSSWSRRMLWWNNLW